MNYGHPDLVSLIMFIVMFIISNVMLFLTFKFYKLAMRKYIKKHGSFHINIILSVIVCTIYMGVFNTALDMEIIKFKTELLKHDIKTAVHIIIMSYVIFSTFYVLHTLIPIHLTNNSTPPKNSKK